jgi:hypothetical protein
MKNTGEQHDKDAQAAGKIAGAVGGKRGKGGKK